MVQNFDDLFKLQVNFLEINLDTLLLNNFPDYLVRSRHLLDIDKKNYTLWLNFSKKDFKERAKIELKYDSNGLRTEGMYFLLRGLFNTYSSSEKIRYAKSITNQDEFNNSVVRMIETTIDLSRNNAIKEYNNDKFYI